MEKAARDGNTENRRGLASGRVSVVLEMAVTSQASGRQEAGKQGAARLDFAYGDGESDLGEHHAFTVSCSSWASTSLNRQSHAGFDGFRGRRILSNDGLRSCAIIAKRSVFGCLQRM
jgi:hypothetical protein